MEITCVSCGMEATPGMRYPSVCRVCERSMSEEEILALIDGQ